MPNQPPVDPLDPFARRPEPDPAAIKGTTVQVRTADGVLLAGVPIRRDTVLVEAGGLTGEVTVIIDGQVVLATAAHEITKGSGSWHPLTALELPENTLPMVGHHVPPGMAGLAPENPDHHGVQTPFWCLIFPRMQGC